MPVRTDINPAQIDSILAHSFILERVAPGIGRLRVAGQSLNTILGMETRGMPLSMFFTIASRPTLAASLEHVFNDPAIVEMPLKTQPSLTRSGVTARLLLLPLQAADGTISRALGALVTDGPLKAVGKQFGITDDLLIRRERVLNPCPAPTTTAAQGRSRDHLRLVVSNR